MLNAIDGSEDHLIKVANVDGYNMYADVSTFYKDEDSCADGCANEDEDVDKIPRNIVDDCEVGHDDELVDESSDSDENDSEQSTAFWETR